MNELKKTMLFGGAAIFLALLAFITAPRRVTPEAFSDTGELFFPNFTDPNAATTLEVIDYNKDEGAAVPFKVTFKDGQWTIPSHHDYPADGKDRLAKTAAGVIGIRKDEFRSDNTADHAALGVIDPLDDKSTALEGRGKRITLKDANDEVLADFIVSDEIEGKSKFRFVRIPGKKRVYASRMDIDISTKFSDWIEPDLLQVDKNDITKVTIRDYSINERSGRLQNRDTIVLNKDGEGWKAKKMTSKQEVNTTKMNDFLKALDELSIVDVRPKPEGLTQSLRKSTGEGMSITQEAAMSLQPKGFYFTREGELVSNEGEVQARTREGLVYTLRFGEVVHGADASDSDPNAGENRYLFLTTTFDGSQFVEPPKPKNTDFTAKPDSVWTTADRHNKELQDKHDAWAKKIEAGQKRSTELNEHFAHWYYVISSKSFEKIHLKRADLLKNKKTT